MSTELMDTLESKVFSAVDTIETLRTEINGLRDERRVLEDKLRELIGKMDGLGQQSGAADENAADDAGDSGNPAPFRPNY